MADPAHRARAALTNYNYYIFLFKADPAHRARAARRAPHGRGPAAPREAADLGSISARSRLGLATGDAPPRRCRRRGVRRAGGCRGSSLGRLEDAAFVSLSGGGWRGRRGCSTSRSGARSSRSTRRWRRCSRATGGRPRRRRSPKRSARSCSSGWAPLPSA